MDQGNSGCNREVPDVLSMYRTQSIISAELIPVEMVVNNYAKLNKNLATTVH